MFPEICKIGPFTIYSYGLMLAIAFLVSSRLTYIEAKKEGIYPDLIFNFLLSALIVGIIGARIFYVSYNIGYYIKRPLEIIMLQQGGLSWFGGLILSAGYSVIYLKKKKIPAYKMLDLIAPYLALAHAIGRVGCLANGCCFGRESQSGIYFAIHHAVLIPTQVYSSLALLAIFIILRFMQSRPHQCGTIFFSYLLLYSVKRFFIEFLRADNQALIFGLTLFQLLSAALFFFAAFKLIALKPCLPAGRRKPLK